jgi:hypothetical protein
LKPPPNFSHCLPSEVEAAVFFPAEDSEAELELLAVLRLTIQNKRRAFNKTKKVTATATPTTTSIDVVEDIEAGVHYVFALKSPILVKKCQISLMIL